MKKNKIKNHINLYFLLLVISPILVSKCTAEKSENDFQKIDELVNSAIMDSVFPGAAVVFGNSGEIIFHKAYGHFTYDVKSNPVDTTSIFDLASVSKVVGTTSAALLLVQRGELSLNDKVIKYLPEFNNKGKDKITVENLLLHNSGLPSFKKYYDIYDSADEVINDIMNLDLNNPPGIEYVYSDLGMITLQKIIEKISGTPLDLFLKSNLFDKLEMNNTLYNPSNDLKNRCVPTENDNFWRMRLLQGEVHDERAYMLNGVAGHAGLFSTAGDLAKFAIMILNKGKHKNSVIFEPELLKSWTRKQSDQSDRALGWDTKSKDGYSSAGKLFSQNSFGHTGYTGTSIWIDWDNDLFVILLTNRVHPTRNNRKITEFRPKLHDMIFTSVMGN